MDDLAIGTGPLDMDPEVGEILVTTLERGDERVGDVSAGGGLVQIGHVADRSAGTLLLVSLLRSSFQDTEM